MSDTGFLSESSFRIDKYLVNDIHGFNMQVRLYEENWNRGREDRLDSDEKLVRNVIYSVASDYEHNLLGFGQLDPAAFARQWNYDPSYLRRRVENPYQLKNMSGDAVAAYRARMREGGGGDSGDAKVWDTRLENALYILSARPVDFDQYGEFVGKDGEGEEVLVKAHTSFTLFRSISAVSRGRGKTVYLYTLNENFEKNLTRYYIRGEKQSLLNLRAAGLDSLYLYLVNLRTNLALKGLTATTPGELPDFEYLCRLADIPAMTKGGAAIPARERKRNLAEALQRVLDGTELEFNVTWNNAPGKKAEYVPVLDFGTKHLLSVRPDFGYGRLIAEQEQRSIHRQVITKNILDMYRKIHTAGFYTDTDEEAFNAWALDNGRNRREKETALRLAYIWIFRRIPDNEAALTRQFFAAIEKSGAKTLAEAMQGFSLSGAPEA